MSARTYLLRLICAVLVPLLGFAGLVLVLYSANERARFEEQAAQIARHAALVVDGEVESLASLLRGLAVSSTLEAGNLAQFHAEARRLVANSNEIVILRELGARQILNTQVPFGTELPDAVPLTSAERSIFAQGRLLVSNVYPSPLTSEFRIAVALPISAQRERPGAGHHRADIAHPRCASARSSRGLACRDRRPGRQVCDALAGA
jgi:hypothetical protein